MGLNQGAPADAGLDVVSGGASASSEHAELDLALHRIVIAVACVGLVVFGVLSRVFLPDLYDPLWMRVLIAAVCGAILVASFRSGAVRDHLHAVTLWVAVWIQGWFILLPAVDGWNYDRGISTLLISCVLPLLFRRAGEAAGVLAFSVGLIVVSYGGTDEHEVPLPVMVMLVSTVMVSIGAVSVWRARLSQQLADAHDLLEERVQQRTAQLREEVEERRTAERQATLANRAKSRFLANMSHELRTPLNAITGYAELVEEELSDREQGDLLEDTGRIRSSANHLLGIIDDVLDLSRIEAGKVSIELGDVSLPGLVEECFEVVRPLAAERSNQLLSSLAVHQVHTDRNRLKQVLVNLLTNAATFTDQGEIDVVTERVDGPRGPSVQITVTDTGCGIPPGSLPTLFDKFTQVDESSTRRHGGTGLGLAISKELMELLGGTVEVDSILGSGSTFRLRLPARTP